MKATHKRKAGLSPLAIFLPIILTIVQNPLIGRAKQKLGNSVFSTWKGLNVLKSKPLTVENPNTINQQMRRSALRQTVAIYRFIAGVVQVGWKEFAIHKSEYNAFSSYTLKNAFDYSTPPAATINPAAIAISNGSITKQAIAGSHADAGDNEVTVTWDASNLQPGQSATDKVLIGIVNQNTGQFMQQVTDVDRSAETITLETPFDIAATQVIAIYLGFYNPSTFKASLSDYTTTTAA